MPRIWSVVSMYAVMPQNSIALVFKKRVLVALWTGDSHSTASFLHVMTQRLEQAETCPSCNSGFWNTVAILSPRRTCLSLASILT